MGSKLGGGMSTLEVSIVKNVRFLTEEHSGEGRFRADMHTTSSDRWVISYEWFYQWSMVDSKTEVFTSAEECLSWLRTAPYKYLSSFALRAADALAEALP
jgi:hypothetical protein